MLDDMDASSQVSLNGNFKARSANSAGQILHGLNGSTFGKISDKSNAAVGAKSIKRAYLSGSSQTSGETRERSNKMLFTQEIICYPGGRTCIRKPENFHKSGTVKQVLIPVSRFLEKTTGCGKGRVTHVTQTESGIHIVVVEDKKPKEQESQLQSDTSIDAKSNGFGDIEDVSKFEVFKIKPNKEEENAFATEAVTHQQEITELEQNNFTCAQNREVDHENALEELVSIETISEMDTGPASEINAPGHDICLVKEDNGSVKDVFFAATDNVESNANVSEMERIESSNDLVAVASGGSTVSNISSEMERCESSMDLLTSGANAELNDDCMEEGKEVEGNTRETITTPLAKVLKTSTGYFCSMCIRAFDHQVCCESHIIKEHNKTGYKCLVQGCGNQFSRLNALKKHWILKHEIYDHTCSQCKMGFLNIYALTDHIKKCDLHQVVLGRIGVPKEQWPQPQSKYYQYLCKHCNFLHVTAAAAPKYIFAKRAPITNIVKYTKPLPKEKKQATTNRASVLQKVRQRGGFSDVYNQCKKCLAAVDKGLVRIPGKPGKNVKRTMMLELVDIGKHVNSLKELLKLTKYSDILSSFVKVCSKHYMCIICGVKSTRKYVAVSHYIMYHEMVRDKSSLLGLNKDEWVTLL